MRWDFSQEKPNGTGGSTAVESIQAYMGTHVDWGFALNWFLASLAFGCLTALAVICYQIWKETR